MIPHLIAFVLVSVSVGIAAQAPAPAPVKVPDITGQWTASFETQIGQQDYTYDFVVKDGTLTGKAKSNLGEAVLTNGKVAGTTVTFEEMLKFMDMEIPIAYTGSIVSADEIKFTRQVGEFATEELVAKRVK